MLQERDMGLRDRVWCEWFGVVVREGAATVMFRRVCECSNMQRGVSLLEAVLLGGLWIVRSGRFPLFWWEGIRGSTGVLVLGTLAGLGIAGLIRISRALLDDVCLAHPSIHQPISHGLGRHPALKARPGGTDSLQYTVRDKRRTRRMRYRS